MKALGRYLDQAHQLGEHSFLKRHSGHYLLVQPFQELQGVSLQTLAGGGPGMGSGSIQVAPLEKRAGANAFASMITVGRARNNDLVFNAGGVSKFHAYFTVGVSGEASVIDVESTHGTFVNYKRLASREPRVLRPNDQVRFGGVSMVYQDAPAFYKFLAARSPSRT